MRVSSCDFYTCNCETEEVEAAKEAVEEAVAPKPAFDALAWPNPTSQFVNFRVEQDSDAKYAVTVFDLTGKVVRTARGVAGSKTTMNVSDFSAGLYIYRLVDVETGRKATGRFVVE